MPPEYVPMSCGEMRNTQTCTENIITWKYQRRQCNVSYLTLRKWHVLLGGQVLWSFSILLVKVIGKLGYMIKSEIHFIAKARHIN